MTLPNHIKSNYGAGRRRTSTNKRRHGQHGQPPRYQRIGFYGGWQAAVPHAKSGRPQPGILNAPTLNNLSLTSAQLRALVVKLK